MTLTLKDIDKVEERFRSVFATKEDLLSFATKEDLLSFATKEDLTTFKSDLINKLDSILKEILASREEETILSHRVSNHEDRLEKVEKKLGIQPAI